MPDMAPSEGGSVVTNQDGGSEVIKSEIIWGTKRGIGVKGKGIQFYDSFTYEGVEYSRYDCVYLHKEGEPEPYIGKIIKIWEDRTEKKNKMKVMWFFRPIEIRNWLDVDISPTNKEIFLASGEGKGVFNINILDVIVGKCKVLCTSLDKRNPQPSEEDVKDADYFFYRTFDVGKYTILQTFDNIEDSHVAAEFVFNKPAWVSNVGPSMDRQVNGAKEVQVHQKMTNEAHLLEAKGEVGLRESPREDVKENDIESTEMLPAKEDGVFDALKDGPKKNEVGNSDMASKMKIKEDNAKETTRTEVKIGEKKKVKQESSRENTDASLKMRVKDDDAKESTRTEAKTSEKKQVKEESSREEKKSLKRQKLRVDSDDDEDGMEGLEEVPRKGDSKKEVLVSEKKVVKKAKLNDSASKASEPLKRVKSRVDSDEDKDGLTRLDGVARKEEDFKTEVVSDERRLVKKAKLSDNAAKSSEGLVHTVSQPKGLHKEDNLGRQIIEITKRPEVESNKWFKGLPWDERLRKGYEQKAVILVQNFDPSYTSTELEDIMWHVFGERCVAKVIPKSAISNPKVGQALVIFKSKEGADTAVRKLEEGCLVLSDGRPLVATKSSPVASVKFTKFAGHISVEKHKLQMQRALHAEDMKKAVSTSHCSQPNTIEYEMAMEWRFLQEKSERWWRELYKQEDEEINKVKRKHVNLSSKKKSDN